MSATSLSLLSGGKKDLGEEAAAQVSAPPVDVVVQVDIDSMTMEQIDALVAEHKIAVPGNWKKCSLKAKVKWLKDNLPEEEAAAPEAPGDADAQTIADMKEAGFAMETGTAEELKAAHAILIGDQTVVDELAKVETSSEQEVTVDKTDEVPATAPNSKPKGKGKAKGKAVATSNVKHGEIVAEDPIVDMIYEIENLNEKMVYALLASLKDESSVSFFKLGGVFSLAQSNGWFNGYANLKDFAEKGYGIGYRDATYYVSIYNSLAESKVSWEKVKGIGWTKLKEIAKILTVDNVDEWVEIATENNTLQLIEVVKAHKNKLKGLLADDDAEAKTVTTKTFKMHDGQREVIEAALQKAKEATGSKVDTVALETISQEYIASPTLLSRIKSVGLEAAANLLEQAFPLASITIELQDAPAEGTKAA